MTHDSKRPNDGPESNDGSESNADREASDASRSPKPSGSSKPPARSPWGGLCPQCRHVKILASDRGSTFLLCRLGADDPRFTKYPPQPVVSCRGFDRLVSPT